MRDLLRQESPEADIYEKKITPKEAERGLSLLVSVKTRKRTSRK